MLQARFSSTVRRTLLQRVSGVSATATTGSGVVSHPSSIARVASASSSSSVAASCSSNFHRSLHTTSIKLTTPASSPISVGAPLSAEQYQALKWVDAYRTFGHLFAGINPLKNVKREKHDRTVLLPSSYGLSPSTSIPTAGVVSLPNNPSHATVAEIEAHLEATYCAAIGVESQGVATAEEREWLNQYLESANLQTMFSTSEKRNIYNLLYQSEFFDLFMSKKFTSFKRYGLEGAESALVALDELFVRSNRLGYEKVVLGMPHRGRLNMLVSLLDYPARALFAKVKGLSLVPKGMDSWDDVASHIAQTVTKKFDKSNTSAKPMTVSLLHNPSHLEAVNPVAIGKVKAKQLDYTNDAEQGISKVLSLQLHGDSAYAGQGIVPETLQMAYLNSFSVGGTIHMIVNNQLGFTTGGYGRNRSSRYSSDIGKIISMPVVHVNADSPESVVFASRLVSDFHSRFHRDIMLDIIGYRKHGHNEVDEPSFTQPTMYQDIRERKNVVQVYGQQLQKEGVLDFTNGNPVEKLSQRLNTYLEKEMEESTKYQASPSEHFQGKWNGFGQTKDCLDVVKTGLPVDVLKQIGVDSVKLPAGFTVHPRLKRGHIDARLSALSSTKPDIDWATAETLAFGSLVKEGYNLRLCGQDVERGTFSQRHLVLTDQVTDATYEPLSQPGVLGSNAGRFQVVNSHLSEEAVLGFEYGFSWESPKNFNIWEAQFGDFNNGAQILIDTFIGSSESKWMRASALTMLLPHGYDGAGPEHSSSRMERFLQMCDDDTDFAKAGTSGDKLVSIGTTGGGAPKTNNVNMLVANVTTPAQYYHLLRRQMLRKYRKPLVVITPKTLLRHADAVSSLDEMNEKSVFQTVLNDTALESANAAALKKVDTVVLLTGKVYYDLIAKRTELKRDNIAFLRLEELCPFPKERLVQEVSKYTNAKKVVWFQEEPANMGAWAYVQPRILQALQNTKGLAKAPLAYVGRIAMPSPAVGAGIYHKKEVEALYQAIFAV